MCARARSTSSVKAKKAVALVVDGVAATRRDGSGAEFFGHAARVLPTAHARRYVALGTMRTPRPQSAAVAVAAALFAEHDAPRPPTTIVARPHDSAAATKQKASAKSQCKKVCLFIAS